MSQEQITELFKKALEETIKQATPHEAKYDLKLQPISSEEIVNARSKGVPSDWVFICESLVDKKWYVVKRVAIKEPR